MTTTDEKCVRLRLPLLTLLLVTMLSTSASMRASAATAAVPPAEAGQHDAAAAPGDPVPDHPSAAGHGDEHEAEAGHGSTDLGRQLPLWSVLPFAGILLSIALFPLVAPHFWHRYFPWISLGWALVFAVPFMFAYHGDAVYEILHIYLIDYIPFIILLWGLFTVSGGIVLRGTLRGSPKVNSTLLLIGTAVASWVGTTGASMVLIRPLLRANAWRRHRVHTVIFFIFLVSNIGGSLTPLGDPPLFLGFLHGVPFFWTFSLLPEMLVASAVLLVVYFALDTYYFRRDSPPPAPTGESVPIGLAGIHNFLFLGGIIAAVLMSGLWRPGAVTVLGVHVEVQNLIRDGLILGMGVLSLMTTSQSLRKENEFSWFPIQEVAYLFAGIFMTIIPALAILKAGQDGALSYLVGAVREPVHYFWVTGILSSFLDNAPTYLTFFNTALGAVGMPESAVPAMLGYAAEELRNPAFIGSLKAIAVGAVFMGANTYIGNAPNFMVRSIAEESGVAMPSFFGYLLRWSLPILFPLFAAITVIFFI